MSRRGFTLMEMVVVIAIVSVALALAYGTTLKRDERRAQVQGAAIELAATLRLARSYAMERNVVAAVTFNIANAPGSSGRALNNRSGGHWYRIVGPARERVSSDYNYAGHFPFPRSRFYQFNGTTWAAGTARDAPFRGFLEAMDSAWYGEAHILPKGKVRFLAIGDQDNGCRHSDGGTYQPAGSAWFYPRPWFGRWDETRRMLHAWGGYDPDLRDPDAAPRLRDDGSAASFTGFFYEGRDGPITGCTNPADRGVLDDTNGDGVFTQSGVAADDQTKPFLLYRAGESRPLIDARWLDLFLIFNPDGSILWGPPFAARREWGEGVSGGLYSQGAGVFGPADVHRIGPGDRLGHLSQVGRYSMYEVSNYTGHTGAWYITLAPDLPGDEASDRGSFGSVREALASMLPMFRVYATPDGEIGWFEVRRALPQGAALDPTVGPASWDSASFLKGSYTDGSLRDADYRPLGRPAADALVPEMLTQANWWLQ